MPAKRSQRKPRHVRVAMVKVAAAWGDVDANIRLFRSLTVPLEGKGIDVVISPEGFLDGYMVRDRKRCTRRKLAARCVSGPSDPAIRRVARVARRLGSYVVIGAPEKDRDGVIRNAAYLLDREGRHVGTYYKVMPGAFFRPGPSLPVFETDFAKVGIVICADRRWPENIRTLRLKGAEMILNPTWGTWDELNTCVMRTRAYENGIPVCFTHPNLSLICGPDGRVAAMLESNVPDVLVHDLDLNENVKPLTNDEKAGSHPIQNRRPELWSAITSPVREPRDPTA